MNNKNVLHFSLSVLGEEKLVYYAMLYNALRTLSRVYDASYDVVVFYDLDTTNFSDDGRQYIQRHDIFKDFPFVQFIESNYSKKFSISTKYTRPSVHDSWMMKHYTIPQVFDMGYEKLLFLDTDVIFTRNIADIFDKYPNDVVVGLNLGDETNVKVMGNTYPSFGSGQYLIHKNLINTKTYYETATVNRIILQKRAEELLNQGILTDQEYKDYIFFNEMFCVQKIFNDNNIPTIEFYQNDFVTASHCDKHNPNNWYYKIDYINDNVIVYDSKTAIIHYSTAYSGFMIPNDLRLSTDHNQKYYWDLFIKTLPTPTSLYSMNKNVIMFPLFIEKESDTVYYSMLYYALQSLIRSYNNEFDIVVYYYSSTYDIETHKFLTNTDKNLFKDFPQVKFIKFPYQKIDRISGYFFKWNAVDHVFSLGYEKAFIIDTDVIFYQNPAYLFDKYGDTQAHVCFEGSDPTVLKVLGRSAIAGGQLILSSKIYHSKINNIYEKILFYKNVLLERARLILDDIAYTWFETLCDQYALFETLINSSVELSNISTEDLSYGEESYEIQINNNEPVITSKSNIVHYLTSRAYKVLPTELLPAHLEEMRKVFINDMLTTHSNIPQATNNILVNKSTKTFSEIVSKHGSDKISNGYGPIYDSIFKNLRNSAIDLLEIGLGTKIPTAPSNMSHMGNTYSPGASLRAFKEYFTYGMIYGGDVQDDCMIEEDRIKTFKFDSTNADQCNIQLADMRFDIIIDDGLHTTEAQIKTFRNLWPRVKNGGFYFIEDVWPPLYNIWDAVFCDIQAEKWEYKNAQYTLIIFSKP